MKRLLVTLMIALICTASQSQTVGLVLSGGGAKGIAHVGLIKALEENDIPIDYITGTSMGAIVGALYAMGYTPDEMMSILTSQEFLDWAFGVIPKEDLYYFLLPEKTPEIVTFNLGRVRPDTTQNPTKMLKRIIPESVINPVPMNFAFMELFDPYTAQCGGNFDNLFVPFRAIAANVNTKQKEVFAGGSLGNAVRASMSIPIAYKPITINGNVMYDGGIYDNFPVRPMEEEFHPDFIIGSRLASNDTTQVPLEQQDVLSQLLTFVMQKNDYTISPEEGIVITCPTQDYTMFDFNQAQAIYNKGYEEGIAMVDSVKGRITRRMPAETRHLQRQVFKSRTPQMRFNKEIIIDGVSEGEKDYIARQFFSSDTTLSLDDVYRGFIRNISTQKLSDLRPQAIYNPTTGLFDLHLTAKSKEGISVGVGAYISSHNNNSLYIGAHYHTLRLNSLDFDAGLYLGQSYQAGALSTRINIGQRLPMYLRLNIVSQAHHYNKNSEPFYVINAPTYISNNENYIKLSWGLPVAERAKVEISAGCAYIVDRYLQREIFNFTVPDRDMSKYYTDMLSARIETNWLDNLNYPTKGGFFQASASYVYAKERTLLSSIQNKTDITHNYVQLRASAHYYLPFESPIAIGLRGEVAYNNNRFCQNYTATIIQAPAFEPTPSTRNLFNTALRANQFIAAGILPIWKITNNLQLRTEFYGFLPIRPIYADKNGNAYYGEAFEEINIMAEASMVYSLPWASLSAYYNYCNISNKQWNFGVTLGVQLFAPKFLQ